MGPRADTIEIVGRKGTNAGWQPRRDVVDRLVVRSMCEVQRRQLLDGTSLGVFRPGEILDWTVEPASPRTDMGQQLDMFEPSLAALEDIPYKFRYRYRCRDEPDCPTHTQRLLDWELGEAYRSWRPKYGDEGVLRAIQTKWREEVVAPNRDVMFFVGSIRRYPKSFCVLGVFWPPGGTTMTLF